MKTKFIFIPNYKIKFMKLLHFSEVVMNADIYLDLSREFLALEKKDPECTVEFMLSGKESLLSLKKVVHKVSTVRFQQRWHYNYSYCSSYLYELITLILVSQWIDVIFKTQNPGQRRGRQDRIRRFVHEEHYQLGFVFCKDGGN